MLFLISFLTFLFIYCFAYPYYQYCKCKIGKVYKKSFISKDPFQPYKYLKKITILDIKKGYIKFRIEKWENGILDFHLKVLITGIIFSTYA